LRGESITVFGDGKQTRSFCFVDDLIGGIVALMDTPKEFTGPMNLGNPHEMTMIELATHVIELTNSSSKIVFKPLPSDDPVQRRPDTRLAEATIGWNPSVQFRDGLAKTVEYFKRFV